MGVVVAFVLSATAGVAEAQPQEKVDVCHKPGTPAEKTLSIAEAALSAHLAHDDQEGPCNALVEAPVEPVNEDPVNQEPVNGELEVSEADIDVDDQVVALSGKVVKGAQIDTYTLKSNSKKGSKGQVRLEVKGEKKADLKRLVGKDVRAEGVLTEDDKGKKVLKATKIKVKKGKKK